MLNPNFMQNYDMYKCIVFFILFSITYHCFQSLNEFITDVKKNFNYRKIEFEI